MFIWAHRGASADAPENTMPAFRTAKDQGADGIELDIHLSSDNIPVVIHDTTLNRTTNLKGDISDYPLQELQQGDAGSWFSPEFCDTPIPTLEEVLKWVGTSLRLNIEIKDAVAGKAVIGLIQDYPLLPVLISSFHHKALQQIRSKHPNIPLGYLVEWPPWGAGLKRALKRAIANGAESFHPRINLLNDDMITRCQQAGLGVAPWVVDDPKVAQELKQRGVTALFTNKPGLIKKI